MAHDAALWIFALAFFGLILRRFFTLLEFEPAVPLTLPLQASPPKPADEDDAELPQTDRAPRYRPMLAYAVAGTAALRLVLLVALHR